MEGGKIKIGPRELEIVEHLQRNGQVNYAQLLVDFSPVACVGGKTYSQYSVLEDRLLRMQKKGLIVIEKKAPRTVRLTI